MSVCSDALSQPVVAAGAVIGGRGHSRGAESGTAGTGYLVKLPEVAHVLAVDVFPEVASVFLSAAPAAFVSRSRGQSSTCRGWC